MRTSYQWQGEPVKVEHVGIMVYENKEPLYWYNYEIYLDRQKGSTANEFSADIPALKITYKDKSFYIANHFGIGINKLKKGGWPNSNHFSFSGKFKECVYPLLAPITKFDLEGYEAHEASRYVWQRKNYPEEVLKMDQLKASIKYLRP